MLFAQVTQMVSEIIAHDLKWGLPTWLCLTYKLEAICKR